MGRGGGGRTARNQQRKEENRPTFGFIVRWSFPVNPHQMGVCGDRIVRSDQIVIIFRLDQDDLGRIDKALSPCDRSGKKTHARKVRRVGTENEPLLPLNPLSQPLTQGINLI